MAITIVYDSLCRTHEPGSGHPEKPERLDSIRDALSRSDLRLLECPSRKVTVEELRHVHDRNHVDELMKLDGQSIVLD